jgi:hypothetical protein
VRESSSRCGSSWSSGPAWSCSSVVMEMLMVILWCVRVKRSGHVAVAQRDPGGEGGGGDDGGAHAGQTPPGLDEPSSPTSPDHPGEPV